MPYQPFRKLVLLLHGRPAQPPGPELPDGRGTPPGDRLVRSGRELHRRSPGQPLHQRGDRAGRRRGDFCPSSYRCCNSRGLHGGGLYVRGRGLEAGLRHAVITTVDRGRKHDPIESHERVIERSGGAVCQGELDGLVSHRECPGGAVVHPGRRHAGAIREMLVGAPEEESEREPCHGGGGRGVVFGAVLFVCDRQLLRVDAAR